MTVSPELTETEKEAVENLRLKVQDDLDKRVYSDDDLLYRFLKGNNFDLAQAEKFLRKAVEWRKETQMDVVLTEYKPPEFLAEYIKHSRIGFDKEGNFVHYTPIGAFDVQGIYMSAKYMDIEKTFLMHVERDDKILKQNSIQNNAPIGGHVFIMDMEGLSFAMATDKRGIEICVTAIRHYQDFYPERLRAVYIINAAQYFSLIFSIIKNFLRGSILDKIYILGPDWKEELLKVMDADQLPAFLGGTRTDPDGNPLCNTCVNHGGPIDEKHYAHKSKNPLAKSEGVQKLTLARASFSEIEVKVREPGSFIEWEFETRTLDIGFGLFFKELVDGEEKISELVPLLRMDTEHFSETGMYKCDRAGTYVILFDNSYSWIRSKEIFYRTKVITPKEHEEQMKV